ncbi:hypothetical protein GGX14DRAFT_396879 [Mycena pura]|uniref:Uncharacterized protein n=1 Tax=Mycena pura TaxID=153505 RepID=A0AAD6Y824_9AGAR|nr:hypothetical protein GGX14DRAFT_396879 [Mycena pura]
MPPPRELSLLPITMFAASEASSPAPEGSTSSPENIPNDLAHLRALRLRRFAPAAPALVVAQSSTSVSVTASVPASTLVVTPPEPAPALVVAPPLVVSHISAVFPSSPGATSEAAPPRLFICLPARPHVAVPQRSLVSSAPAVVASAATQPAPVPAVAMTYTTYDPDFLEYSTVPGVVPPGRILFPIEQRRQYDALWRAGHFDQVPYGWCPQDEWTMYRLDFWPVLHDIRTDAVPRPMARPASVVPFVYGDLWTPPPLIVEHKREVRPVRAAARGEPAHARWSVRTAGSAGKAQWACRRRGQGAVGAGGGRRADGKEGGGGDVNRVRVAYGRARVTGRAWCRRREWG